MLAPGFISFIRTTMHSNHHTGIAAKHLYMVDLIAVPTLLPPFLLGLHPLLWCLHMFFWTLSSKNATALITT
jgi:hypothetical protein